MTDAIAALSQVLAASGGVMFAVSASAKLLDLDAFRQGLLRLPHVPVAVMPVLAVGVPLGELALAIGICLGSTAAAAAGIALLALFTAMAVIVLRKRLTIDCGCLGAFGERRFSLSLIAENAVWMAILGWSCLAPPVIDLALAALAGAVVLAAFHVVRRLRSNHRDHSALVSFSRN